MKMSLKALIALSFILMDVVHARDYGVYQVENNAYDLQGDADNLSRAVQNNLYDKLCKTQNLSTVWGHSFQSGFLF